MEVTSLYVYPVKSLRGHAVSEAEIDELGIVGDRRFLVVGPTGECLTQRTIPAMATVDATLSGPNLTLAVAGGSSLVVSARPDPQAPLRPVKVWSSEGLMAEDCGPEAKAWLTAVLGTEAALVRIGTAFLRPVKPSKAKPGDRVAFTDAYPFMVISEASLSDLNDRLVAAGEEAVPMERFRPTLVIRGAKAFEEDTWSTLSIGTIQLRAAGPCARCIMTTTDHRTGERFHEPLKTLSRYRRDPQQTTAINFGQNLIHETKHGSIRVGDPVRVSG